MRLSTKLLAALNRRTRWSEGHIFAVTPEQIGLAEGLRASLAVAVMLIADIQLHIPELAYGAVAAFWTCLCDPIGPDRTRLRTLLTFIAGSTVVLSTAAYCAHWGRPAGCAGLFVLVLLCGLTRSYRPALGPMPSPTGLIAAIAVVIGAASPRPAVGALELAGGYLIGGVWATVLCLYLWRIDPRAPARRRLVAVFARLEDMLATLRQADRQNGDDGDPWDDFNGTHRRAVRFSIERGREIVARLEAGRSRLGQGIDAAGRVFAALTALGHHRSARQQPFDDATERPLLDDLDAMLQQALLQSETAKPDPEPLLTQGTALIETARSRAGTTARSVAVAAGALVDLARHWQEPEPADASGEAATPGFSLNIPAAVWRHALRMAVAVSISYILGAWYDVTFSYWGTIATLVLVQPLGANTWLRVLERGVGSIVGGLLTAILIARLSGPVEMLLFITPLAAAVIALRLVNYGLFVIFVTPMFVLVSDFIHPADHLIAARAVNEAIGACIGLAGSLLLWPEKEKGALSDAVLAALSANMAFAAAVLRTGAKTSDAIDQIRRTAGLTSARAEVAWQRLRLQGRPQATLEGFHAILIALRAVCGAANVVAITCTALPEDHERADRYDTLTGHLRAAISGTADRTAAALAPDTPDDLGHAIHALTTAVLDHAAETKMIAPKAA